MGVRDDRPHRPYRHELPLCRGDRLVVQRALGFEREAYKSPAEPAQRIALKFGRQKFNLRPDRQPRLSDSQGRCTGRSLDLCFITEGSLKPIIERWKRLGIPIAAGPAPRTGALGRMTSWAGEHESCQYP